MEEESEKLSEEIPWAETILDFANWQQEEDASVYDEELEEALAEDDPPYVIFRFGSYHRYFFRKWISLCALPAILVLVQLAAILLSGVGLSGGNTWRLPAGSLDERLFQELSRVFSSPLTALAGVTGYLFFGIWLTAGLCM